LSLIHAPESAALRAAFRPSFPFAERAAEAHIGSQAPTDKKRKRGGQRRGAGRPRLPPFPPDAALKNQRDFEDWERLVCAARTAGTRYSRRNERIALYERLLVRIFAHIDPDTLFKSEKSKRAWLRWATREEAKRVADDATPFKKKAHDEELGRRKVIRRTLERLRDEAKDARSAWTRSRALQR